MMMMMSVEESVESLVPGKPKYSDETCCSDALSTTIQHLTSPGLEFGSSRREAKARLSREVGMFVSVIGSSESLRMLS
jgi:hypothetical protein